MQDCEEVVEQDWGEGWGDEAEGWGDEADGYGDDDDDAWGGMVEDSGVEEVKNVVDEAKSAKPAEETVALLTSFTVSSLTHHAVP
jgi:hypothetical protein